MVWCSDGSGGGWLLSGKGNDARVVGVGFLLLTGGSCSFKATCCDEILRFLLLTFDTESRWDCRLDGTKRVGSLPPARTGASSALADSSDGAAPDAFEVLPRAARKSRAAVAAAAEDWSDTEGGGDTASRGSAGGKSVRRKRSVSASHAQLVVAASAAYGQLPTLPQMRRSGTTNLQPQQARLKYDRIPSSSSSSSSQRPQSRGNRWEHPGVSGGSEGGHGVGGGGGGAANHYRRRRLHGAADHIMEFDSGSSNAACFDGISDAACALGASGGWEQEGDSDGFEPTLLPASFTGLGSLLLAATSLESSAAPSQVSDDADGSSGLAVDTRPLILVGSSRRRRRDSGSAWQEQLQGVSLYAAEPLVASAPFDSASALFHSSSSYASSSSAAASLLLPTAALSVSSLSPPQLHVYGDEGSDIDDDDYEAAYGRRSAASSRSSRGGAGGGGFSTGPPRCRKTHPHSVPSGPTAALQSTTSSGRFGPPPRSSNSGGRKPNRGQLQYGGGKAEATSWQLLRGSHTLQPVASQPQLLCSDALAAALDLRPDLSLDAYNSAPNLTIFDLQHALLRYALAPPPSNSGTPIDPRACTAPFSGEAYAVPAHLVPVVGLADAAPLLLEDVSAMRAAQAVYGAAPIPVFVPIATAPPPAHCGGDALQQQRPLPSPVPRLTRMLLFPDGGPGGEGGGWLVMPRNWTSTQHSSCVAPVQAAEAAIVQTTLVPPQPQPEPEPDQSSIPRFVEPLHAASLHLAANTGDTKLRVVT
jgi:hypothetical protein